MMRYPPRFAALAVILALCCALVLSSASPVSASEEKEEKKKGLLEEFLDDFEDDDEDDDEEYEDDDDGWFDLLGDLFRLAFRIAWWRQHPGFVEPEPVIRPLPWRFEAYPYATGGAFAYRSDLGRSHFVVPTLTYHHVTSGLRGLIAHTDLRFASRWGLQAHYASYSEQLFKTVAEMDVAGLSLKHTMVQTPRFYLEGGGGLKALKGDSWHSGFNLVLCARAFPVRPLVLSLGMEAASINDQTLTEASGTVGFVYNTLEFRVGLRSLQSESHSLNGLQMGVGAWF